MANIIIMYWRKPIAGLKYKHLQQFPLTTRKLNSIVKTVLNSGNWIMIQPIENGNSRLIWINDCKFGQS